MPKAPYCSFSRTHGTTRRYVTAFHEGIARTYYRCPRCGLIFEDPGLAVEAGSGEGLTDEEFQKAFVEHIDITDGESELYPDSKFEDQGEFTDGLLERVLPFLVPHGQDSFEILEVGCATGFLLRELKKSFPKASVLGIEPSPVSCRMARQQGVGVLCGTLESVDLGDRKFDAVIVMGNLMLHSNPFATLLRIRELLASQGRLIFDVKNPSATVRLAGRFVARLPGANRFRPSRYFVARCWGYMRYAFSKETLSSILTDLGYEIEVMETHPPRLLAFSTRHRDATGLRGALWRFFDWVDQKRDQRAWIQVCCTPTSAETMTESTLA